MPVFDFSNMQAKKEPVRCTYTMVYSDNDHASPENPILVIDNQKENGNIIPLVFSQIQINRQLLNLKKKMAQSVQIS